MKLVLAAVLAVALNAVVASTLAAEPASGVPSADACGPQTLKADGTAWRCTFVDNFSGTTLDRSKWQPQTSFASGSLLMRACYLDDPSTVSVAGGNLVLAVRRVLAPASCGFLTTTNYVAGMVSTYHLFSQQYGRFQARMFTTATSFPGLHEAFWLWPDDRVPSTAAWPAAGEIDVSETYSIYPDLSIPFLHYSADAGGPQPGVNTAWDCAAPRGQWNTYTLEWGPERIEILVNGKSCLVNTSADPAFQKPYIVLLTAALGDDANGFDGRAPIPATTLVDYVKVWH
jgi:beta-glucanase (GH16 family)